MISLERFDIEDLESLRDVADEVNNLINDLGIVDNRALIVAGTKALHITSYRHSFPRWTERGRASSSDGPL
jgi:hypothetical protein